MPEAAPRRSGKVREIYALDDERLLLVATDRISTFDVVLPTEIPDKGRVLTGLSGFWFARTRDSSRTTCSPSATTAARWSAGGSRCCRSSASSAAISPVGLEGLPGERRGLRAPAARGPARVRPAPRADLHAGDEGARGARREHHARAGGRARRARSGSTRSSASRSSSTDRGRSRGRARDHPRRHEVRARARRGREARARRTRPSRRTRRASGPPTGTSPAARSVVRQAVRPRLLRVARLGQDRTRARSFRTTSSRARARATSRPSSG